VLAAANRMLGRMVAPNFTPEPYLEINDLERAITLSTADAHLAARERLALQNIVLLSDLSAEELMRPRRNLVAFSPPVTLEEVRALAPQDGYVLVTEPDSEEIAGAVPLKYLPTAPRQRLEQYARPVVYVPWCATAATAFDELQRHERDVAVVVNELGETIGIITEDDIVETVFEEDASRSERLLATSSLAPMGDDRWRVTGMTNLRRLGRHFDVPLEPAMSVTVGGLLQELLQRLPEQGDEVSWSGFDFRVLEAPEDGALKVELKVAPGGGPLP
jgi:CBS domain containing-hemolysin-like protein